MRRGTGSCREPRLLSSAKQKTFGGVDKRALARGREAIKEEVMRKVPALLESGGYFPSLDPERYSDQQAQYREALSNYRKAQAAEMSESLGIVRDAALDRVVNHGHIDRKVSDAPCKKVQDAVDYVRNKKLPDGSQVPGIVFAHSLDVVKRLKKALTRIIHVISSLREICFLRSAKSRFLAYVRNDGPATLNPITLRVKLDKGEDVCYILHVRGRILMALL